MDEIGDKLKEEDKDVRGENKPRSFGGLKRQPQAESL